MKGNIKQGQELEALINQITSIPMTVAIKEEDLDYLHQAKAILKRRIHSFPKDDEPRVDSVILTTVNMTESLSRLLRRRHIP